MMMMMVSKTNTRRNYLFSALLIKLTWCNDNSNRPSTKSWTDKNVETSESVEGVQEMSVNRSLSERWGTKVFIADNFCS